MKTSQAIPGPATGTGNQQALTTGGMTSPEVSPAMDPSAQVAKPKPAYGGVDVSRVIEPTAAPAAAPSTNPAQNGVNFLADNIKPKNASGGMVADMLRNIGSSYPSSYQPNQSGPNRSARPSWQSMGGWQSLMQRMQPR